MPKWRAASAHRALIFPAIYKELRRQLALSSEKFFAIGQISNFQTGPNNNDNADNITLLVFLNFMVYLPNSMNQDKAKTAISLELETNLSTWQKREHNNTAQKVLFQHTRPLKMQYNGLFLGI